jgi:predicted nucleotidyltransferase component of viral defense system
MAFENSAYFEQVQLLVRMLPIIGAEHEFALKGGTAINLFVRNFPRLSVDIDLAYLPILPRNESLLNITKALQRIERQMLSVLPITRIDSPVFSENPEYCIKKIVFSKNARVKIEVSPVMRGTVYACRILEMCPKAQDLFGFANIAVVSFADLFAGKMCAALNRQNPRDLFDIHGLLKNEGLDARTWHAFLVYLACDKRSVAELLAPRLNPLDPTQVSEFQKMTEQPVTLELLEQARSNLLVEISSQMTADDREFLISFKQGNPKWELIGLPDSQNLPAVKWKLENIKKMFPEKHKNALQKLKSVLGGS